MAVFPTPLRELEIITQENSLRASNKSVFTLLDAEVEAANKLLTTTFGASGTTGGGNNRNTLEKDMARSNDNTAVHAGHVVERLTLVGY
jgi:hypothetical protein